MKPIVLLFIATAVFYGIARFTSNYYGGKVAARFLETGTDYTAETLQQWVKSDRNSAARYAFPVLFPLDLLFMAFLAAFFSVASVSFGESIEGVGDFAWLFAILPAVYLGVDLAEDTILARMLTNPDMISFSLVRVVQMLTKIKIAAVFLSCGQLAILFILSLIWRG